MITSCVICGTAVFYGGVGRPRTTCSEDCAHERDQRRALERYWDRRPPRVKRCICEKCGHSHRGLE